MSYTNSPNQASPQDTFRHSSGDATEQRDGVHAIACIACSTRKVKCDRQSPSCSNCVRSNATCEYRAPLPRGPRKRKYPSGDDLYARLERYEEMLKSLGVPDPQQASTDKTTVAVRECQNHFQRRPRVDGKIVQNEKGRPRYIENKLWDSLAEEIPHDQDDEEAETVEAGFTPASGLSQPTGASDGALLLGQYTIVTPTGGRADPKTQYFTPVQIMAMLDLFSGNVDPLCKILHMPTFTKQVAEAAANPTATTRKFDALVFAMMFSAAMTMTNQEALDIFYMDRSAIMDQLQDTTSRALIMADILRSDDIEVLQAFTLYLLAMRERLDLRTTWMLTGNAIRIAMGMGIHRGGKFESHFTPFEIEYRRRLWWQVAVLDMRTGELAGFGASPVILDSDAGGPTNLNDADLFPDMKALPPPRTGATEMIFVKARTLFREFGRSKGLGALFMGVPRSESHSADLERRILDLEQMFESQILRYCDPLEPLHILVSAMARTVIHRLRLKTYHPKMASEELSPHAKDICFNAALKTLEYDNHICGSANLQKFLWHVRAHFQWDALIYVLSELRRRGSDADTARAWKQVEQKFTFNPEFIEETRKPLHLAVSNLCVKAWAARETAHAAQTPDVPLPTPRFIMLLREKHAKRKTPSPGMTTSNGVAGTDASAGLDLGAQGTGALDFGEFANASLDPSFFNGEGGFGLGMDWSLWNDTLQYHEPSGMGLPWAREPDKWS